MKWQTRATSVLLLSVFAVLAWITSASAADVPRMTKEELKAVLGNSDVIVIDVRTNAGWSESKLKIKGTVREDPGQVALWLDKYPKEKTLVFYCS